MPHYEVFKNPEGKVVSVETGFSWAAFLFGPLWAFAKRAWALFFALMAAEVVLVAMGAVAEQVSDGLAVTMIFFLFNLLFMYLCGRFGNGWLASSLMRKGYRNVGAD